MMTATRIILQKGLCTRTRYIASSVWESRQLHHDVKTQVKQSTSEAVLYFHWPYCARRCSYCNFNKYINRSVNHERMTKCLIQETKTLLELSGVTRIKSIFFGGGTPSLALPETIDKVVKAVKESVTFDKEWEVTLEANPTHLETNRLRSFHDAGVNRLSIGVQCLSEAKSIYGGNISVDLIFGRPGQSVELWLQELNQVLKMNVNHVSLYQLTVERGTMLYKWVESGKVIMPDNDTMADMYTMAVDIMASNGLDRYEVSNFAKKGFESKHNQAYWQGIQYIGIGPGAHGRFTPVNKKGLYDLDTPREARVQTLEPDNWMYEVEKYGHATRKITSLSIKDRLEELLCSGLRTREGITKQGWEDIGCGHELGSVYSKLTACEKCVQLVNDGFMHIDDSHIKATSAGLLILDSILPHLLYELDKSCQGEGIT